MDKIATYLEILESHPLWTKEAGADAAAYRLFKPQMLRAMNARTPGELMGARTAFKGMNKDLVGKMEPASPQLRKAFKGMDKHHPKGSQTIIDRARALERGRY